MGNGQEISYRPDLPDWGVYLRWPEAGENWIHDEDRQTALALLPGRRVFRRSQWDGEYYWLHYGQTTIRVKPTMWVSVPSVDLEVGNQVEVLSLHGQNDPGVFFLSEILYSPRTGEIEFYVKRADVQIPRSFSRDDLRPIHVRHHLRTAYYQHAVPKSNLPDDLQLLDVGESLLDEQQR